MNERGGNSAMGAPAQPSQSLSSFLIQQLRVDGLSIAAVNSAHASERQEELSSPGPFGQLRSIRRMTECTRIDVGEPSPRPIDFRERAISAAAAAIISAVIVNPLDVAKTRLQAQAAGVAYHDRMACAMEPLGSGKIAVDGRCPPTCPRTGNAAVAPVCPPPGPFQYKSTWDVVQNVVRQEGFFRLWRGTNAALAIAVPTVGIYLPFYDILREKIERYSEEHGLRLKPYAPLLAGSIARSIACIVCSPIELARTRMQAHKGVRGGTLPGMWDVLRGAPIIVDGVPGGRLQGIRLLWTGVGAQLVRDVPFSAICWTTLEPVRQSLLIKAGPEPNASTVVGANFSAGVLAGSIAAAVTCPLDVAKTRRQIEKDPLKAMKMTTRQVLLEIWRKDGVRGLFTGVGPRVARAGPSVGIVVSFYEAVKYILHKT